LGPANYNLLSFFPFSPYLIFQTWRYHKPRLKSEDEEKEDSMEKRKETSTPPLNENMELR
jgi:hypothetical protein